MEQSPPYGAHRGALDISLGLIELEPSCLWQSDYSAISLFLPIVRSRSTDKCQVGPEQHTSACYDLTSVINEEMYMGNRFLRLSVVYFVLGVTLGIFMAASHDYTFRPVHAHLNLLGWVSMALFGLWYRGAPASAESRLAKAHFWLHNIALPIQMITLAMFTSGDTSVEPVLALASVVIGIGLVCFAINLWKHTGR